MTGLNDKDKEAKMKVLGDLIDMMKGSKFGKLKKKGAPDITSVSVEKVEAEPLHQLGEQSSDAKEDKDELSEDMLQQLLQMRESEV